jgi:hypothetical protein
MRAELRLLDFKAFYETGYSVVHTHRAGGLHGVVVSGLRSESRNAHPENHVGLGRVAAIRRLSDLRQVHSVGAIVHDAGKAGQTVCTIDAPRLAFLNTP